MKNTKQLLLVVLITIIGPLQAYAGKYDFQFITEEFFPQFGSGCAYGGARHEVSKPWEQLLEVTTIERDGMTFIEFEGLPFVSHFCRADRPGYPQLVSVPLNENSEGEMSYQIKDEPSARKDLTLSFRVRKNSDGKTEILSACTWGHLCSVSGYVYHAGTGKEGN
jgi:hypothetical protein